MTKDLIATILAALPITIFAITGLSERLVFFILLPLIFWLAQRIVYSQGKFVVFDEGDSIFICVAIFFVFIIVGFYITFIIHFVISGMSEGIASLLKVSYEIEKTAVVMSNILGVISLVPVSILAGKILRTTDRGTVEKRQDILNEVDPEKEKYIVIGAVIGVCSFLFAFGVFGLSEDNIYIHYFFPMYIFLIYSWSNPKRYQRDK